jgi:predicted nucleic acid-binding protein
MKAVVDIDVFTVALWDKQDERKEAAEEFLDRIEDGEVELYLPLLLFQQIHDWKHNELATRIAKFQFRHSEELVDVRELENSIEDESGKLVSEVLDRASEQLPDVKESDLNLVLYASSLEVDLVTFDRKHLLDRKDDINRFLEDQGLPEVRISSPEDLSS